MQLMRRQALCCAAAIALSALPAGRAAATCNLIPAAPTEYRSTQGTVSRAIAPPGDPVVVRVDLACNPTARGFDPVAANNHVTLHFVPPGSTLNPTLVTDVPVTGASVENCALGGGRCDTLRFTLPDTDAQLPPAGDGHGLTGPAEILVRAADNTLIADIGPLYDPTLSCDDHAPDDVFAFFTVLPLLNSFGALAAGTNTTALATIDGGGNLLLPMDYSAVLPGGSGSPQFRLLQAGASVDAFSSKPGFPIEIPNATFVRSFNTAGRPIPPVLDVNQAGDLILGSTDAAFGVIRVARIDPFNGGAPLYDLSDRLDQQRGPILIQNMQAKALESAPLDTLSADPNGIAFARTEAFENTDLDGDEDLFDRVAQVVDIATGTSTSCAEALTEVNVPPFVKPLLGTGSGLAAFAESEARQGHQDIDGNGDSFGNLLRVFSVDGTQLTTDLPQTPVDPQPVIDNKPLEISNGFVFFRTREGDGAPRTTALLTPSLLSPSQGESQAPSLSFDGRFAGFQSSRGGSFLAGAPAPAAGFQIYVLDRQTGSYELVSRDAAGNAANAPALNPSISGDGRYVAYESAATNLACSGSQDHIFVYDRQAHTVQCASAGLVGSAANGPSSLPSISRNGRFVAFNSAATNLVGGDVDGLADFFVFDRQLGTTSLVTGACCGGLLQYAAAPGERPAISADGHFVAGRIGLFSGASPYFPFQIVVIDRLKAANDPTNAILTGDAQGSNPAISDDGHFVAWSTPTPIALDDTNAGDDVYVLDTVATLKNLQLVAERVSVDTEGRQTGGAGIEGVAISGDGRFVAFDSNSGGFVPGSGDIRAVYRYDRAAQTVEQSSMSASGQFGDADASSAAISGDGRVVAFSSAAENLAAGPYGPGPALNVFARATAPVPSLNAADTDDLDTVLQVFDSTSKTLRTAPRLPANSVAVAAGRAAFLSSEADDGGINRNPASGDTDANDVVARFYDANTDTFRELGVAADRIAISDQVVCLTDPEAQENNTDLDGDGDTLDDVVAAWNIAAAPALPTNVGVPATAIGATGTFCVFTGPNRVLEYYDASNTAQPPSAQVKSTHLPARDFVAKGDLVAFRVCEFDISSTTVLNGDGDSFDCVMHVLRLSTGVVTNTQMAASICDLPGCDPFFEPYRVLGNTVSFLTREADQSGPGPQLGANCSPTGTPGACDLNNDGDADDLMITVFNVDSSESQLVTLGEHDVRIPQDQPPFPILMDGRIVLPIKVPESQVGVDLNGDGKIDDTPVVLVVGDVDKDGALDSAINRNDSCVEVFNPDQTDHDGDGLGDEAANGKNGCDPNPNSILPGAKLCDVDGNGVIDRNDVSVIFGDRGMTARASDPRDADRDGKITTLDVSLCSRMCKNPSCAPDPPPPHCGLIGIEPALVAGLLFWQRRRLERARKENEQ
jgi:Tol biopolymer transport system component